MVAEQHLPRADLRAERANTAGFDAGRADALLVIESANAIREGGA